MYIVMTENAIVGGFTFGTYKKLILGEVQDGFENESQLLAKTYKRTIKESDTYFDDGTEDCEFFHALRKYAHECVRLNGFHSASYGIG